MHPVFHFEHQPDNVLDISWRRGVHGICHSRLAILSIA